METPKKWKPLNDIFDYVDGEPIIDILDWLIHRIKFQLKLSNFQILKNDS